MVDVHVFVCSIQLTKGGQGKKMNIKCRNLPVKNLKTNVVAVPVQKNLKGSAFELLDRETRGRLREIARSEKFKAKKDEVLYLSLVPYLKNVRIILTGTGSGDEKDPTTIRRAAVFAARTANTRRANNMAFVLPQEDEEHLLTIARAAAEGLATGAYLFNQYRGTKKAEVKRCVLAFDRAAQVNSETLQSAVASGITVGEGINMARDLVNSPGNAISPQVFADYASGLCRGNGLEAVVMKKKHLEKENMNLLMAVGQGSAREPMFLHIKYKPESVKKGEKKTVIVGKGITFDAGGLSLKTSAGMQDMKVDMSGAAVALATIIIASRLSIQKEIHALIPLADNMPSATATRPGDIITSRSGKTVEILNTDAEGRLILADALSYAGDLKPGCIIDLATLTGACVVALGPFTAGLFSRSEELAQDIIDASGYAGESIWRLPLLSDLESDLRSSVADMKNIGNRWGGAITAALFLKKFVKTDAWAHIDIAGPAFTNKQKGQLPKGGTGFGVLTLVRFLETK